MAEALARAAPDIRHDADSVEESVLADVARNAATLLATTADTPAASETEAAYRALSPPGRVLVVLETYAGMDAGTALRSLRGRRDELAAARDDAYARLAGGAAADDLPDPRAAFGEVLRRRVDDVPLDPAPYERVAPLLRRHRRRRAYAGLVAAVTVVLVVLGSVVLAPQHRPDRTPVVRGDVTTWPVRGSLVGDRALLDSLARWAPGGRALFAGEAHGRRVVLVVRPGVPRGPLELVAFVGRTGDGLDRMERLAAGSLSPWSRTVAWADPEPAGTGLLVVLAPSDARSIAVSTRPVPRFGHVERTYVTHVPRGGVVFERVRAPSVRMMRVSVTGTAGSPYDGPVQGVERTSFYPGGQAPAPRRSYGDVPDDEAWGFAAADLAGTYRLTFAQLDVLWRWTRQDGGRTYWMAAAYRLRTGAVVLQALWWSRDVDNRLSINRYIRGRPLLDAGDPVAWRMGDQVAVLFPDHPNRRVVLHGGVGSAPEQVHARTADDGFTLVTVPRNMRGAWLEVPLGHGERGYVNGLILTMASGFDHDPLDVGASFGDDP
ncbi:MAG: hypothetical protein GEV10_09300 [Streptosporangiales bacterium]|nr:hypothetical protein [Streptosporangiales bacterium]